jgi:hypothetical protein
MVHLIPFSATAFLPDTWHGSLGLLNSQDGWNFRFSIADCRLLMDIGGSCHATFSFVNRQSAIGNENQGANGLSTFDCQLSPCFHATAR